MCYSKRVWYDIRGGMAMSPLRVVLYVILMVVSVLVTGLVLMQEGKQQGLGAISGAAETYWGKNKGRSMEGKLVKWTAILVIVMIVLSAVLNITRF